MPPHAAMKYLVPLARANQRQCEPLLAGLGDAHVSDRELGALYTAWRRADRAGKQRVIAALRALFGDLAVRSRCLGSVPYLLISIASFIILVTFAVYIFATEKGEGQRYIFGVLFAVPSGAMVYMGAAFLRMWTQALQALSEKASQR